MAVGLSLTVEDVACEDWVGTAEIASLGPTIGEVDVGTLGNVQATSDISHGNMRIANLRNLPILRTIIVNPFRECLEIIHGRGISTY